MKIFKPDSVFQNSHSYNYIGLNQQDIHAFLSADSIFNNLGLWSFDSSQTIYKYRKWNNEYEYEKTALTKQQFCFSSIDNFPDRFDCRLPAETRGYSDDFYKLYFEQLLDVQYGRLKGAIRKEDLRPILAQNWSWYKVHMQKQENRDRLFNEGEADFDSRIGILSLTTRSDNKYLWEQYADSGKGYCIGIDLRIAAAYFPPLAYLARTYYFTELPERNLQIGQFGNMEEFIKKVASKKMEFKEEDEIRAVTVKDILDKGILAQLPPSAIREVHIGKMAGDEEREKMILAAEAIGAHVTILIDGQVLPRS